MLKCSDIMYSFEIDGTLVDNITNRVTKNELYSNSKIFNGKLCINPRDFDIRWSIVTPKSIICKPLLWMFCFKHGLNPCEIITSKNKFICIKDVEKRAEFKINLFRQILDGHRKVKYTTNQVNHIIHVCNDQTESVYINSQRNGYPFMSVNNLDFKSGFFSCVI